MMDIGFFYDVVEPGTEQEKVVLYYREEEFYALAGLLCLDGLDPDEIAFRTHTALQQSTNRLFEEVAPMRERSEKMDVKLLIQFIKNREELPVTAGRKIKVV
jgi:hypothetical protein